MKRTALVTGASAGLGTEFARQLAAQGLDLLLVARREERLKELARELGEEHGVEVTPFAADLARREAPEAIEGFAASRGLAIDYLINNQGGDSWPCRCGADRCRGETGKSFFSLPDEFQRGYLPLLAPWFCERYASKIDRIGG